MRSLTRKIILAAASLISTAGIVALSDPAFAATTGGAPQVSVPFDVQSAATAGGRSALDYEIRAAASHVGETDSGAVDFLAMRCRNKAVGQAKASLDDRLAMIATPVEVASR